jgi:hypothetical protein
MGPTEALPSRPSFRIAPLGSPGSPLGQPGLVLRRSERAAQASSHDGALNGRAY